MGEALETKWAARAGGPHAGATPRLWLPGASPARHLPSGSPEGCFLTRSYLVTQCPCLSPAWGHWVLLCAAVAGGPRRGQPRRGGARQLGALRRAALVGAFGTEAQAECCWAEAPGLGMN